MYGSNLVKGNNCSYNKAAGIHATDVDNSICDNTCTNNTTGLHSAGAGNYFQQNLLSGNTSNEFLAGSTEGSGDLADVVY